MEPSQIVNGSAGPVIKDISIIRGIFLLLQTLNDRSHLIGQLIWNSGIHDFPSSLLLSIVWKVAGSPGLP